MGDTPACSTCKIFRPDAEPRQPHRPPVCDGDRRLLHGHLGDIANLIADLTNPEPPIVDQRRYERFIVKNLEGTLTPINLGETWADPLAQFGGVAPINSRSKAPTVTGSRERHLPIRADVEDLKAPARVPEPSPAGRDWPEDQIGHLSAATVLDQWVRDVRDLLYPGHHLPPAAVDEMVVWLRNRVEDICDRHPAVADFADEIRHLRGALRSAAGQTDPRPERCDGVPCRHCDLLTLFREPGGDVVCINVDCQAVLRENEYQDWVKTLAAEQRVKRHAQQNA